MSSACVPEGFVLSQELHESYKHNLNIVPLFEELTVYQERQT